MAKLLKWLRDLLEPPISQSPLDTGIETLSANWDVASAVVLRVAEEYAAQRDISLESAVKALSGQRYDKAKAEVVADLRLHSVPYPLAKKLLAFLLRRPRPQPSGDSAAVS